MKEYRVVPWEDCRKYKRRGKRYPEIGNDLSAAILVDWTPYETNVQKRLSVDLISAIDESLLWSDNFIIKGNWPTEICRHSRKISKKITRKLKTYLTPQERALIDEQPALAQASFLASIGSAITQDTWEMVQTGTKANDPAKSEYTDSISFDRAIKYFSEAIKADPTFAEAYANRAKARLWGINAGFYDLSVLAESEKDIRKATDLQPNLPEAHVVLGFYYYYGRNEYKLALTSFEKAVELRPNKNEYLYYLSIIWRALANWEKVQILTDKVFDSNPRNVLFLTNLGISYLYLQDIPKSIECHNRAIELMPQWFAPYINKIDALVSIGNLSEARAVLMEAIDETGKNLYRSIAVLDLYERKYSSAFENIEKAKAFEFKDHNETLGDAYLLKAKIYKHAGYKKKAEESYERAVDFYTNLIVFNPGDTTSYSRLGIAYAGIGANQKADESGKTALKYINLHENRKSSLFILHDLIQLYAIAGDQESARNMMNELLARKAYFTSESLNLDPDIQPLFGDPGI